MPPLPNRNNNPGDLRFIGQTNASQGQGGFAEFPTPQDGTAALLNDIQSKINRNPNETLDEFSHTYAPAEDGNDPGQYTANLANTLGVAPNATIGSLQSRIGDFAGAVAKNEGYHTSQSFNPGIGETASQVGQAAGTAYNAVGGAPGVAAIGTGLAGVGALGAGLLGEGEAVASGVGNVVKNIGGFLGGLVGGGGPQDQSVVSPQQAAPVDLGSTPPAQQPKSQTYLGLQDLLSQTVGGRQISQEAQARGIDPLAILEETGAGSQLQPDENGNIDKETATATLNNFLSQDKGAQREMVGRMTSPTHLDDMQKAAEESVSKEYADTGERSRALKEVQRIFDDYRAEQPTKTDKNGNPYVSKFINPARLQKKKELLSVSERDFALPRHERAAATHVKEAMRRRLSQIAEQEGVKGWDETNKRMESMILAKKAIKKLPKKAPRDKFSEFKKDLAASLLSGAAGKVAGQNPMLAGMLGYLIEHNLSRAEYKKLGSSLERKEGEKRAKGKLKPLLSGKEKVDTVRHADNKRGRENV